MDNMHKTVSHGNTRTEIFRFDNGSEVREYHVMIHVSDPTMSYHSQLEAVLDAYDNIRKSEVGEAEAVFKRYYLSDAANQADEIYALAAEGSDCALSVIQQAPLDGTKVALWAYMQTNTHTRVTKSGLYEVCHGTYRHLWNGSAHHAAENSEYQTRLLLNEYVMQLAEEGCSLADNCIRTWFFVNDVDQNYSGVVRARNQVFFTQNLTEQTHFIASTGIGGRQESQDILVQLDDYAVAGIHPGQIKYLYAADNMNRTSDYGVSFERGTSVDYGDRRHVFISGTASIDNKGNIMFPGDIRKQPLRMWENVAALLDEAECTESE